MLPRHTTRSGTASGVARAVRHVIGLGSSRGRPGDDRDDDRADHGGPEAVDVEAESSWPDSQLVSSSISALITNSSRPSVRMMNGIDRNVTTGRTMALTTPKTTPTSSSVTSC